MSSTGKTSSSERRPLGAAGRHPGAQPPRPLPRLAGGAPGPDLRRLPAAVGVVGHRPRRLLDLHLGVLRRRPAGGALVHSGTRPRAGRAGHARRPVVPHRHPQLRRPHAAGGRRRRRRRRPRPVADPGPRRPHRRRAAPPGGPGPGRSGPPRCRAGRPGGGLPAQHPRDAGRLPGHRQPRGGVGVVRPGVRHPQRPRPLHARSTPRCCWPSTATATARRPIDRTAEVAAIREGLPGLAATVAVPYLDADGGASALPGALPWAELLSEDGRGPGVRGCPDRVEAVPFDHPLYVLYSSGTTGLPKPIVHGHGGILLEHVKQLAFFLDLGPGDRFFWFSTTGWMMWNLLVSGLAVGSALVLFDGDLGSPDLIDAVASGRGDGDDVLRGQRPLPARLPQGRPGAGRGVRPVPAAGHRLDRARRCRRRGSAGSTRRSPPTPSSTRSAGEPTSAPPSSAPARCCRCWEGRISGRLLGAKVEAFDPDGRPVVGEQGELVITEPMPSMPVGFWGDADGSRYRSAYFDDFPGVWRHGDWIVFDDDGSCVISGRSDSTLNRGGVRLGTSEFYSVVEGFAEVGRQPRRPPRGPVRSTASGWASCCCSSCPAEGCDRRRRSRRPASPGSCAGRCRPATSPTAIHAVSGIPRTLSGKKLEVPVKRILTGTPTDVAASRGALANPDSLEPSSDWRPDSEPRP